MRAAQRQDQQLERRRGEMNVCAPYQNTAALARRTAGNLAPLPHAGARQYWIGECRSTPGLPDIDQDHHHQARHDERQKCGPPVTP